jgi:Xaa-Pro dipeptidase
VTFLHYHRAYKTDYELHCLREANRKAVQGHLVARQAFFDRQSEFDIELSYLKTLRQTENEAPYSNIIALNEHAAVLHYTLLESTPPQQFKSLLIDAGATVNGYASDITRTYSFGNDQFSELIAALNEQQLALISQIKPGISYVDLHIRMHQMIAQLLVDFDFVNITATEVFDKKITATFFPHGLGHFLGLQVHDVGGFMHDEHGTHIAAPDDYPFLRCTRVIEARQVLTIEPGLYFIESLLDELKAGENAQYVNWDKVAVFKAYGGIRIEDNIVVHQNYIENMTRDCGLD